MKKNISGALFLLLFFAMLLSGVATMPFIKQDGTAEKRILAEFPDIKSEDGTLDLISFPAGFEDWLDDHIGLRMVWMQQYANVHAALGSSVNEQVIVGNNGWLYFEPTVSDFTGVDTLTENERWRVRYVLETIDRTIDAPFVIFFAPNKSTVYPENMPAIYPESHADHTMQWLINNADLNIIDSLAALSGNGLYHLTDTHWNNKGARIGASLIINEVNALTGADGLSPDPNASYSEEPYVGDLGQMLFPNDPPADSQLIYTDSVQNFKYKGRYRTPEDLTITTEGSGAELNVLMLRDSFTNLLIEPISNAYSSVQYRRAMPLPLSDAGEYDVVILEMVERRIGELLVGTPEMLASEAEAWEETAINCTAEAYCVQDKDRVLIYGTMDNAPDKLTDMRVAIYAGDELRYYDALPVSGTDTDTGDGSFSLYVESLPENAQIQVYMAGESVYVSEKAEIVCAE